MQWLEQEQDSFRSIENLCKFIHVKYDWSCLSKVEQANCEAYIPVTVITADEPAAPTDFNMSIARYILEIYKTNKLESMYFPPVTLKIQYVSWANL